MKHHMKLLFKQIICAVLIFSLSGCWNSRELDELAIVRGIGIDASEEEPGTVQITAQVAKAGEIGSSKNGSSKSSSGGEAFWNVISTGKSVFSAIREMTTTSSRKLFFPHNEILVIGRDTAESGIQKYLDFFERDPETRGKVLIAISETSAEDLLNVKAELEKIPADNISNMIEQYSNITSQTKAVNITDFSNSYMSPSSATVAPLLKVMQNDQKKAVEITGTAVFKGDKMVGTLNETEGRGLLWVLGEVESGIIVVKDSEGSSVSEEIIRSKTKMTPVLEDGKIVIKIEISEEGNIGEEEGTENLAELSQVKYLEDRISEEIESEVTAALKKARELDADIFGFGSAIEKKYSSKWKEIEENWDEGFKTLDVKLSVDADLRLMGKISKPLVPEQG